MSKPWPPPPDLHSIQELVRTVDPEGHLADGAPADEYEPEEDAIFAFIAEWPTQDLVASKLLPVIEQVWRNSFAYDDASLVQRKPKLLQLSQQIERFFGPEAKPQVRNTDN